MQSPVEPGTVGSSDLPQRATREPSENRFCLVSEGDDEPPRTFIDCEFEDVEDIGVHSTWNPAGMKTTLLDR
jgi:hypothetical protein